MNPRKRKLVKDGRMETMINERSKDTKESSEQVIEEKNNKAPMDSFIAKELEEIERIPSEKKKSPAKKRSISKKKSTTKKKTGSK